MKSDKNGSLKLQIPMVTNASSDGEIIAAINTAGEHRYPWRRYDWPKEDEEKSWVKPGDIGESTREPNGDALLKRLRGMSTSGILEEMGHPPRFRVKSS